MKEEEITELSDKLSEIKKYFSNIQGHRKFDDWYKFASEEEMKYHTSRVERKYYEVMQKQAG